jgi:hypothetical protein
MGSRLVWLIGATALLAGCATPVPPLYGWGSYPDQIWSALKNPDGDPQAQLAALQADLERFRARGQHAPPGFHAHLGLLYAQIGRGDEATAQWQTEKTLFPESSTYIDFLTRQSTSKAPR